MAKIDMNKLMRGLERDMKPVLYETLQEVAPDVKIDKDKLFKVFRERMERNFRRSADVSDDFVEVETK